MDGTFLPSPSMSRVSPPGGYLFLRTSGIALPPMHGIYGRMFGLVRRARDETGREERSPKGAEKPSGTQTADRDPWSLLGRGHQPARAPDRLQQTRYHHRLHRPLPSP